MAYADAAALSRDAEFYGRLTACVSQESVVRGSTDALAAATLKDPNAGCSMFLPFITSNQEIIDLYASGGQASIADLVILGSVQASWAEVAAVNGLA